MTFLKIFVCLQLTVLLHTVLTCITARAFGVPILEVGFCLGPTIFQRKVGPIIFRIKAIPLGNYVRLLDSPATLAEFDHAELSNGRFFHDLNPLARGTITGAGYFGVVAIAILLYGFPNAASSALAMYSQIWAVTADPGGAGARILKRISITTESASMCLLIAKVFSKVAGFNFVPLPPGTYTWQILSSMFTTKNYQSRGWFQMSFFAMLLAMLYLVVQLARASYFAGHLQ